MKFLGYILKTKSFYITCLILAFLYCCISIAFLGTWDRTVDTLKTFNQCTAGIIAYDKIPDVKDSFANYERNAIISLTNEEGESLNVYAYEFLDNVEYTDKSIFNKSNTKIGEFSVLRQNEIALPESIVIKYNLSLEDTIYVNGEACLLKFIFRDVYQVFDVNFSISQTVALVGANTIDNAEIANYCNFDPAETVHQQLRNINPIRKSLQSQKTLCIIASTVLTIMCSLFVFLFRKRDEARAFRSYRFSGGKQQLLNLILVELFFILPSSLLTILASVAFSVPLSLLIVICLSGIAAWVYNLINLQLRISR